MIVGSPSDNRPLNMAPSQTVDGPAGFEKYAGPVPLFLDWLVYAGIVVCSLTGALIGAFHIEADTIAYLDLSDAVRLHRWHALVNASWFPFYPALVTIGKASFGNRPQYELMAARLVDAIVGLFFVLASIVLAKAIRRLVIVRRTSPDLLLSPRTLYLWTAVFTYFFVSQDLTGIKPDALLSAFILLAVAALLWGIAEGNSLFYAVAGLFGGLAFLAKAFAFPVFLLCILLLAAVNIRRHRVLTQLLLTVVVFSFVAGPYIYQMSATKGRFTIGDSGSINTAWYVNGADRFNPISDFTIYQRGDAKANFKHPGELLAASPEITYYGGDQVYGTTPQWDDFSYWSDGIKSTFHPGEIAAALKSNFIGIGLILPMRLQVLFLIATLYAWGFSIRRSSFADPILIMVAVLAVASTGSLLLVHIEARYVIFAFVLVGALYAACSISERPSHDRQSLHKAVLLMAGLILLYGFQDTVRAYKLAKQQGAQPMQGIYNKPVFSAGTDLAALYPRGTEVACMGDAACWDDPYWAKFAGLKMTAIIETGNGYTGVSANVGCEKLTQNPTAFDPLRRKHIRAIVADFGDSDPCSTDWRKLGDSGHYFYMPL